MVLTVLYHVFFDVFVDVQCSVLSLFMRVWYHFGSLWEDLGAQRAPKISQESVQDGGSPSDPTLGSIGGAFWKDLGRIWGGFCRILEDLVKLWGAFLKDKRAQTLAPKSHKRFQKGAGGAIAAGVFDYRYMIEYV